MTRLLLTSILILFTVTTASAWTKATKYLVKQQIAMACDGSGKIAPSAVIERDLTGDGKSDLIISHDGISCSSGQRSGFCGMRACQVSVYVRKEALLKLSMEILSIGVSVGKGKRPRLNLISHNFKKGTLCWDGKKFSYK